MRTSAATIPVVTSSVSTDCDGNDIPTERDHWTPDDQLVPAILAGAHKPMAALSSADRCWAVAGLTLAGWTAEAIRDRMECSLRLVRTIKCSPMARVCVYALTETAAFAGELDLARGGIRMLEQQLAATDAELSRVRAHRDHMIDEKIIGQRLFPKCKHPMDRYNTYERTDATGKLKRFCRTCGRERAKAHRDKVREMCPVVTTAVVTDEQLDSAPALPLGASEDLMIFDEALGVVQDVTD
jgi:hypothetical protein